MSTGESRFEQLVKELSGTKFGRLSDALRGLPAEYSVPKAKMAGLLEQRDLRTLHIYVVGLIDMAHYLTSDEALLKTLYKVKEALE